MGMIYKRKKKTKDGTVIEGKVWWIKYYRHGKPYYESTESTKEADAKRLLKKREGEIGQGKLPGNYFDKVRFEELAEAYILDYEVNGHNVGNAKLNVEHLKEVFGDNRVSDIGTDKVKAFIEKKLKEGAPNSSINRYLSALRRMMNLGAQQTPAKVDRVPYIPMLKENNVRKGFFEHEEFLSLRDAMPNHLKGFVTL